MPPLTPSIAKPFYYLTLTLALAGCDSGGESNSPVEESPASQAFPLTEKIPVFQSAEDCRNGGTEIPIGVDKNGNGALDDDEVTSIEMICNGVDSDSAKVDITPLPVDDSSANGGLKSDSESEPKQEGKSRTNTMREVTKAEFKRMYFKYGDEGSGYSVEHWNRFFEDEPPQPMRYMVKVPQSAEHTRMMIVTDRSQGEYRMFFFTEEEEENFFR